MSAYTFVSVRFPWFIKSSFGHWVFWAMIHAQYHIAETQKAFNELAK